MSPVKQCIVNGCSSTSDTASVCCWPRSKQLERVWIDLLAHRSSRLTSSLIHRDRGDRNFCVCRLHFEEKFFNDEKRVPFSWPTLFTEEEILTRKPTVPVTVSVQAVTDHSYAVAVQTNTDLVHQKRKWSNTDVEIALNLKNIHADHTYALNPNKTMKLSSQSEIPTSTGFGVGGSRISAENLDPFSTIEPGVKLGGAGAAAPGAAAAGRVAAPPGPGLPDPAPAPAPDASGAPVVTQEATNRPRQRIVRSIEKLTPKCRKMYSKCTKILKSKRRIIFDYADRIEKAERLAESNSFKAIVERMTPCAQKLFAMQANNANKHVKKRRFSTVEKMMALSLLKRSPKGYKLLQKMFILPTRRTLNTFCQHIVVKPGINKNVMASLKERIKTWDLKKKYCSIVFDEVQLMPHLTFVECEDHIDGFVNFGEQAEKKLCDHALVFMIRGICSAWRQSIAFYLCEGATPASMLKHILKDIVEAVADTGLIPKALICDQGGTFQRCIKEIQQETRVHMVQNAQTENSLLIKNHKLYMFYDPPHLIKCVRNNMLTKDMVFKGKVTKWTDIIEVYKNDCEVGEIRMLPKLTDEHVIPAKIKKMKVKNCTQVLSEKTAGLLNYTSKYATYVDGTAVSETLKNTSEAVLFFDRLFDSVNGSRSGAAPGKMRGPVKEVNGTSKHVSFWKDAIKILKDIYFIDSSSKDALKRGHPINKRIQTIDNWITTLESFIKIWNDLKDIGIKFFYTRNLNQDPLENFFGRIRALNHRNNRPDPYTFTCSFKSLMISDVLGPHSSGSNCEDDVGETLLSSELLVTIPLISETDNARNAADTWSPVAGTSREHPAVVPAPSRPAAAVAAGTAGPSLLQQTRKERINVHSSAFTAGFVSRKLLKKTKCQSCKNAILTSQHGDIHSWIAARERSLLKGPNLKYPTSRFVILFRDLIKVINTNLDAHCHTQCITKTIRSDFLRTADVSWLGCELHHKDLLESFITLVCRVQIHNWCKTMNQILKGSYSEKLSRHDLPLMQKLALKKYQATRVKR